MTSPAAVSPPSSPASQPPTAAFSWPDFGLTNLSQTVTTVPSPPPAARNVLGNFSAVPADAVLVTASDTNTANFFSLQSLYQGCVVARQTGVVASSCELLYTGVKTDGARVDTTCDFVADLLSARSPMAVCRFLAGLRG
ncbi:MAG: hypothetical protein HETSPECPRED_005708 [Heterodermia speciosa]|uniref:Uncharacterized protein n=1 Tax=Heterodermia speciosa TaxID=116794 RepID=A0A8H3IED4_9LECA|nr:MAG: hypothetical protein HETSPECPRED_005708 [Heterodermia speciosa]